MKLRISLFLLFTVKVTSLWSIDTLFWDSKLPYLNALEYVETTIGGSFSELAEVKDWAKVEGDFFIIPQDVKGWMKVVVCDTTNWDRVLEWYFHTITISYARLYVVAEGQVDSSQITGNLIPFAQRATKQRDLSLAFKLARNQCAEVYIYIFRRGAHEHVTLNLADNRFGDGTSWQDRLIIATVIFCLPIILIAIVSSFLFRERLYYLYACYITGGAFFVGSSQGFLAVYLFPNSIWAIETAPASFAAITMASFIAFAANLLGTASAARWLFWIVRLSTILAISQVGLGLALTQDAILPQHYFGHSIIAGVVLILCLTVIMIKAGCLALREKKRVYTWFLVAYFGTYLLVILTLILELGWITLSQPITVIVQCVIVLLEMTFTLTFMVFYTHHQKIMAVFARQEQIEQQQAFSNTLHTRVKGELQVIADHVSKEVESVRTLEQLNNLINACELDEIFLDKDYGTLSDLLERVSLWAHHILTDDYEERSFYQGVEPGLPELSFRQRVLLNTFLREAVVNIKKYSGYKYVSLNVKQLRTQEGTTLKIEVADDGKGIPPVLGLPFDEIHLRKENIELLWEKYFQGRTGIRRLFRLANSLPTATLEIHSTCSKGTTYQLFFRIQDTVDHYL